MNMDRFDLNPRRNHREDAAIPPDLVGTDRLLTRVLGRSPHAADDVDSLSAVRSLADRVFVLSAPVVANAAAGAVLRRIEFRPTTVISTRYRLARVALAAAAAVVFTASAWFAVQPVDTLVQEHIARGDQDQRMQFDGVQASPAELTLVALLRDSSHNASDPLDAMVGAAYRGPAFGGRAGGIARGEVGILGYGRAAGVAVPVLQTRGAGLDDFEDELGAILGSNEA
ncbi:MAG: hypothetical protein SGJ11_00220 [Phycisphaerae bacterium]|nr:hypothetical protein [Phycisphaerae bacterium]